ncbi:UxaA family hydrolase [Haloplanus litoreus]|uniref:UxaA family hydrolase n=1 Tax=Haloplanus litoreus TaxID=767515 RepID=A0ABD5ZWV1_9EURY
MNGEIIGEVALVMDRTDNVATVLDDLIEGRTLTVGDVDAADGETITLTEDVPFGHKIALTAIDPGDPVRKYDEVIGEASAAIAPGEWVHTHNCDSRRGRGDVQAEGEA